MITPYPENINKIELKFFDDSRHRGHGLHPFRVLPRARRSRTFFPRRLLSAFFPCVHDILGCDALLISCTGLRGVDTIARLERELRHAGCHVELRYGVGLTYKPSDCRLPISPVGQFFAISRVAQAPMVAFDCHPFAQLPA